MTRVLLVKDFQNINGNEYLALSLIRGLNRQVYEYFIACSDRADRDFYHLAKAEKIRFIRTHLRHQTSQYKLVRIIRSFLDGLILTFELVRIVKALSVSSIQVHSLSECLKVLPGSILTKTPVIWIVQERLILRRIPRIFFSILGKFVFRFLSVSRYVSRSIRILGVPRNKIQLIPLGFQAKSESVIDDEANRRLLGVNRDQHAVCVVIKGRNRYILETLVQTLRLIYMQYEHVKFFVYFGGDNQTRDWFRDLAGENIVPKLHFVESFKEVCDVIKSMDITVEIGTRIPFSYELLESMSSQVAVVANRSGAIPELVVDRTTGILVPPQDAKSLAKAIIELLSDKPLREQMAREGRKRILQHFRMDDQSKALMSVFKQVQSKRRQLSPY